MVKAVEMKGSGKVVDQDEINRNLALLDEVLMRLIPLVPAENITKRVERVLQVTQEHADLIAGKGVQI